MHNIYLGKAARWPRRLRNAYLALFGLELTPESNELYLDKAYRIWVPGKGLWVGTLDWWIGDKAKQALLASKEQQP